MYFKSSAMAAWRKAWRNGKARIRKTCYMTANWPYSPALEAVSSSSERLSRPRNHSEGAVKEERVKLLATTWENPEELV